MDERLAALLDTVLAGNAFQRARIGDARALADLPLPPRTSCSPTRPRTRRSART